VNNQRVTDSGLASLANDLITGRGLAHVVVITSGTTGNAALRDLDLRGPRLLVAVMYDGEQGESPEDVTRLLDPMNAGGSFDLAIADPHHTYESTTAGLELGLQLVRPGGVMLVHDCLPPRELMAAEFQPGPWCGESYAAFRDVCLAHHLPWITLHADFGIGVVVQTDVARSPRDFAAVRAHDSAACRAEYEHDPYAFMQVVAADDAEAAINALLAHEEITHLRATFDGWDAPSSPRLPEPPAPRITRSLEIELLVKQVNLLREERDQLAALSGEFIT